jgi:hypothetical protein
MAERRMFTDKVVGSDAFTEMPATTQLLYFHLGMNADDDGFINNPKKVARSIGSSVKDLELLVEKRFLIRFPSGVVVIKHWLMANNIRKDRYKPTEYQEEFSQLYIKPNKAYTEVREHAESADDVIPSGNQNPTAGQPSGNQNPTAGQPKPYNVEPQDRIGEDRLGKDRLINNRKGKESAKNGNDFIPPTLEEVREYCKQRGSPVDPTRFYDYFEARNWIDSKGNPVQNWKQKFLTWTRKELERNGRKPASAKPVHGEDSEQSGSKPKAAGFKYDV